MSQISIFDKEKKKFFTLYTCIFFIFGHLAGVFVHSTTWNDLFCSCADDVSVCWQMFNLVFLSLKLCFQCNSRIVRTHFASVMTLNNWEMIAETRSYTFRWCSRCCRHRVCLNSQSWVRTRSSQVQNKKKTLSSSLFQRYKLSERKLQWFQIAYRRSCIGYRWF